MFKTKLFLIFYVQHFIIKLKEKCLQLKIFKETRNKRLIFAYWKTGKFDCLFKFLYEVLKGEIFTDYGEWQYKYWKKFGEVMTNFKLSTDVWVLKKFKLYEAK